MKFLLGILIVSSFFLSSCDIIEEIMGGDETEIVTVDEGSPSDTATQNTDESATEEDGTTEPTL